MNKQLLFALGAYVLVTAALAMCPGFVFQPRVVELYAVVGLAIGLAVVGELAHNFLLAFGQGALCLMLWLTFGPGQPFAVFMLLGQVLLPMVFNHWIELIHDANR